MLGKMFFINPNKIHQLMKMVECQIKIIISDTLIKWLTQMSISMINLMMEQITEEIGCIPSKRQGKNNGQRRKRKRRREQKELNELVIRGVLISIVVMMMLCQQRKKEEMTSMIAIRSKSLMIGWRMLVLRLLNCRSNTIKKTSEVSLPLKI